MRLLIPAACLAALSCLATPALAGEWEKLGERQVNFVVDRDTIVVGPKHAYKKLKLRVKGQRGVNFKDIKVHFGNGSVHDVKVRKHIAPGGETRVIDLPGEGRIIAKIVMWYDSAGRRPRRKGRRMRKKAHVAVWGKRGGGKAIAKKKFKWVPLGARKVNHRAEKDTIHVSGERGVFKTIGIKVTDHAIHIFDLKVHFGNGEVQDVPLKFRFLPGQTTRAIDLSGKARIIKKVVLRYRTPGMGKRGTVHIVGKKLIGSGAGPKKPAPAGGWIVLGERRVAHGADQDTIRVTIARGGFKKIKLKVVAGRIMLRGVRVVYGNGEDTRIPTRKMMKTGDESKPLDLPGHKRVIRKIMLRYKTLGRVRAFIRVKGKR